MSLSSAPSLTLNSENVLASGSLAGNASSSGNIVDFGTNSLGGTVGIKLTGGGTVAATNGLKVEVFMANSTGKYDAGPILTLSIATVASTEWPQSFFLMTGKYSLKLTNLDTTNAVTVAITSNPIA